jgi:hypothetical protein
MALGLWVGNVQDGYGRCVTTGATIEVRDPTNELVALYRDKEGTKPLGNPYLTQEDGIIKFYCEAGRINIYARKGADEHILWNEIVLDDWVEAAPGVCVCGDAEIWIENTAFGDYAVEANLDFSTVPGYGDVIVIAVNTSTVFSDPSTWLDSSWTVLNLGDAGGTTFAIFYKMADGANDQYITFNVSMNNSGIIGVVLHNGAVPTDCLIADYEGLLPDGSGNIEGSITPACGWSACLMFVSTSFLSSYTFDGGAPIPFSVGEEVYYQDNENNGYSLRGFLAVQPASTTSAYEFFLENVHYAVPFVLRSLSGELPPPPETVWARRFIPAYWQQSGFGGEEWNGSAWAYNGSGPNIIYLDANGTWESGFRPTAVRVTTDRDGYAGSTWNVQIDDASFGDLASGANGTDVDGVFTIDLSSVTEDIGFLGLYFDSPGGAVPKITNIEFLVPST